MEYKPEVPGREKNTDQIAKLIAHRSENTAMAFLAFGILITFQVLVERQPEKAA